jgi:hypothetical protein
MLLVWTEVNFRPANRLVRRGSMSRGEEEIFCNLWRRSAVDVATINTIISVCVGTGGDMKYATILEIFSAPMLHANLKVSPLRSEGRGFETR